MAEDPVVIIKEMLTDAMIEAGAALLARLDEMGVSVTTALWHFGPEMYEWRLLVMSPEILTQGRSEIQGKIRQAIEQLGEKASAIPFMGVRLLDPDAHLIRKLHTAAAEGRVWANLRLHRTYVAGHYIEDAYVYRVG